MSSNNEYSELIDSDEYDAAVQNGTLGKIKPNTGVRAKKINLKFDVETLDLLAAYAFDDTSQKITRASLINLKSLVDMCNVNQYKNNQSSRTRIDFIKLALEARLDNGLDNRKLITTYVMDSIDNKELVRNEILPEIVKIKLTSRAIQHLNAFVADRLIYGYMYAYKDEIFKLYEDLESGNFKSLKDITGKCRPLFSDLMHDIRTSDNYSSDNLTFDLSEGNFENVVRQAMKILKDPGNKLITGSKGMNEFLNGGFYGSNSYLFFGIMGVGKSVVLLNICEWIRKFNNKVKPKDPTKRRAVVYVTQENSIFETIERLFNLTVCGDDIREYTESEVIKMFREKGQLTLNTAEDVDLIFKYYDDKAISTTDLYSIIDDIEDTGREVIALVHDYIERIRSSINHPEIRHELAAVANDYTTIAKRYNIPVIGAGQITRSGSNTIDANTEANRADLIRALGKGAVSESWGILKNISAAYFLHREFDSEGWEYVTFLNVKYRSRQGKRSSKKFNEYIAHPFDPDNGIKLMDDIHLDICYSKTTLNDAAKDLEVLRRNAPIREKKEFQALRKKGSNEMIVEEIDDSNVLDFKFLGEALKNRDKAKEKSKNISIDKSEEEFDKIFTTFIEFDDEYSRNRGGYIVINNNALASSNSRPRLVPIRRL